MDAEELRGLRQRWGYTQRECAELVAVDIRTWKRWEAGWPIPGVIEKLLRLMGSDPDVMVTLEHWREQK